MKLIFIIPIIPSLFISLVLGWGFCLIDFLLCKAMGRKYMKKDTLQNHTDADYLLTKTGLMHFINFSVWVTLFLLIIL